jgi:hypothetical protein
MCRLGFSPRGGYLLSAPAPPDAEAASHTAGGILCWETHTRRLHPVPNTNGVTHAVWIDGSFAASALSVRGAAEQPHTISGAIVAGFADRSVRVFTV